MRKPPGGWFMLAQVGLAVLITIGFSIWQVSRGLDKLELRAVHAQSFSAPRLAPSEWDLATPNYRRIEAVGFFDPKRYFLIENRRHNGWLGYWVIGVLHADTNSYLVNRGWVQITGNVREDPKPELPTGTVRVQGVKWPVSTPAVQLSERNDAWPFRFRSLNINRMAELAQAEKMEIRLSAGSPAILTPAPLKVDFSTAKHWGYAFQWLLIGAAVCGGYWLFFLRPGRSNRKKTQ